MKSYVMSELYYDAHNQQLRHDLLVYAKGDKIDKTYWILYDEGVTYNINWKDETCVQHKLQNGIKLPEPHLPEGSTFEGKVTIGDMVVDMFETPTKHGKFAHIMLEPTSCIPINA